MFELWRIFLLLDVGGVIGGLLYWTSSYLSSINAPLGVPSNKWRPTWLFCVANAFMGVGGAWAALLAMFWARRAPLGRSPTDLLELLATSIVAGYAGNRILPVVAAGITQQLLESATVTAVAAAQSAKGSRVLTEAMTYLAPGALQSDVQTASIVTALQEELRQSPESADTAVLLARVLAERKQDGAGAIAMLKSFVQARLEAGTEVKKMATVFWNLASYFEAAFARAKQQHARANAIAAMSEAVRLDPSLRERLTSEPGFSSLCEDPAARVFLSGS